MEGKAPPNLRLRNEREKRGWTREYVAERIGSDPQSVGRWERGTTFPSPFYRQGLCELFAMNAGELGLVKEEAQKDFELNKEREEQPVKEANITREQEWPATQSSSKVPSARRSFSRLFAIGGLIIAIIALLSVIFSWRPLASFLTDASSSLLSTRPSTSLKSTSTGFAIHIRPGGQWVNPAKRQIVHGVLHFAAKAYPTNPGDPAIDHVSFTIERNGRWQVACIAYPPAVQDIFTCSANPGLLGAPPGQIKVSFDVYDQNGNVNFSPNGMHIIIYSP